MKLKFPHLVSVLAAMAVPNARAQEDPPGIDEVTFGVNMLIGLPVSQQRRAYIGKKMFHLTQDTDSTLLHNGYNGFKEIVDFSNSEACSYTEEETYFYWSMSESSLLSQSSGSSAGKDQTVDLGATIPFEGGEVTASTTIRNALVFGNSDSSTAIKAQSASGKARSYSAKGEGRLYSARVDYSKVENWDGSFKSALTSLTSSPSESNFFKFFKEFGTHGLERVGFGQVCTTSMFMTEGQSVSFYRDTVTEATNMDSGFFWFHDTTSENDTQANTNINVSGTKYTISNKRCEGSLSRGSACMRGIGMDVPVILNWSLKPVWEMDVPGFGESAKDDMKAAFESVLGVAADCAKSNCNGNGGCAPNLQEWTSAGEVQKERLFSSGVCFCGEGWEGDQCDVLSREEPNASPPNSDFSTLKQDQIIGLYSLKLMSKGLCWLKVRDDYHFGEVYNWPEANIDDLADDEKWKVSIQEGGDSPIIRLESVNHPGYYLDGNGGEVPSLIKDNSGNSNKWRVHWDDKDAKVVRLENMAGGSRKWLDSHDGKGDKVRASDNTGGPGVQWYLHLVEGPK